MNTKRIKIGIFFSKRKGDFPRKVSVYFMKNLFYRNFPPIRESEFFSEVGNIALKF